MGVQLTCNGPSPAIHTKQRTQISDQSKAFARPNADDFYVHSADPIGVVMMLGAAILYALHLPINQRVLYEVPAPTVTLYTLLAMSAVVVPAYLIFDQKWPSLELPWWPVFGLTLVTSLSRLSLFMGIKHIGGMQTALLGLGELLVTILFS